MFSIVQFHACSHTTVAVSDVIVAPVGTGSGEPEANVEDLRRCTAARRTSSQRSLKKVISINGEEVPFSDDLSDVSIHDFALFQRQEHVGRAFISSIRRRGSGCDGSARRQSFLDAAKDVIRQERIMRALRHYAHRSDSEADDTEDEAGMSRNASKASNLDELEASDASAQSSNVAANIGATFAKMVATSGLSSSAVTSSSSSLKQRSEAQHEVLFSVREEDALSSCSGESRKDTTPSFPQPFNDTKPVQAATTCCASIESLAASDVIPEGTKMADVQVVVSESNGAGDKDISKTKNNNNDASKKAAKSTHDVESSAATSHQTALKSEKKCCSIL